jgi:hypothetical protein
MRNRENNRNSISHNPRRFSRTVDLDRRGNEYTASACRDCLVTIYAFRNRAAHRRQADYMSFVHAVETQYCVTFS